MRKKNFSAYLDYLINEDRSEDNPFTLDNGNFGFDITDEEAKEKEDLYNLDKELDLVKDAYNLDQNYGLPESYDLELTESEIAKLKLDNLAEGISREVVIRKGVRKTVFRSDKPEDFKIVVVGNQPKEVPLTPQEKANRKRSQMIAAKKRAGSVETAQQQRAVSMQKGRVLKDVKSQRKTTDKMNQKRKLDQRISKNREMLTGLPN